MNRVQACSLFARRFSQYQKGQRNISRQATASLSTTSWDQQGVKSFDEIPGPGMFENISTFIRKGGIKNLYEIQCEYFEKFGPIFKGEIFGRKMVHVADAESNEHILRDEGTFPTREFVDPEVIKGTQFYFLFGNNYERWKATRSPIASTFLRPVEVQKFAGEINNAAEDAVKRLRREMKDGKIADLTFELDGFATENILNFVYGSRMGFFDEPQNPEIIEFIRTQHDFSNALGTLAMRPPLWKYVTTPTYRKLLKGKEKLYSIAKEFGEMSKRNQWQNRDTSLYTKIAKSEKDQDNDDNVNHIAIALGQAGVATTGCTFLWCLYHLSRNPEAQEKAYQEIISVNAKTPEASQFYSRLPYLKACIKESSRLVPLLSLLTRTLEKDTVLHGYNVPTKSILCMWVRNSANSPKYFNKPEEFDPQRWIRGKQQEKVNPYAHLPFGFGVRMCLGHRFVDLELTIGLARILQNFRLEYAGEDSVRPVYTDGMNTPEKELPIKFIERV